MNLRAKAFWIPALFVLIVYSGLVRFSPRAFPFVSATIGPGPLVIFLQPPFLLSLVVLGALGAYWSRRAGGGSVMPMLVALCPALVESIWFAVRLALFFPATMELKWHDVLSAMLSKIVVPGVALLVGGIVLLEVYRSLLCPSRT